MSRLASGGGLDLLWSYIIVLHVVYFTIIRLSNMDTFSYHIMDGARVVCVSSTY